MLDQAVTQSTAHSFVSQSVSLYRVLSYVLEDVTCLVLGKGPPQGGQGQVDANSFLAKLIQLKGLHLIGLNSVGKDSF